MVTPMPHDEDEDEDAGRRKSTDPNYYWLHWAITDAGKRVCKCM